MSLCALRISVLRAMSKVSSPSALGARAPMASVCVSPSIASVSSHALGAKVPNVMASVSPYDSSARAPSAVASVVKLFRTLCALHAAHVPCATMFSIIHLVTLVSTGLFIIHISYNDGFGNCSIL